MAEEVAIAGTESTAKLRNPWGVIGLTLITIGIYYFFWWYFINREMRDLGRARNTDLGQNPTNSVLAITLGALIIVPAIISLWTTSDRIQRTQETAGVERGANGPIIFILLLLISPVGLWYAQNELNKAWQRQAGTAPSLPPTEAAPAPPPPPAPAEPRPEAPSGAPEPPSQGPEPPSQGPEAPRQGPQAPQ